MNRLLLNSTAMSAAPVCTRALAYSANANIPAAITTYVPSAANGTSQCCGDDTTFQH